MQVHHIIMFQNATKNYLNKSVVENRTMRNRSYILKQTLRVEIFDVNFQFCSPFIDVHWRVKISFRKHRPHPTCLILSSLFPSGHFPSLNAKKSIKRIENNDLESPLKPANYSIFEKQRRRFASPRYRKHFARLHSLPGYKAFFEEACFFWCQKEYHLRRFSLLKWLYFILETV